MTMKMVTLEIDEDEWNKLRDMSAITLKAYLSAIDELPSIDDDSPGPELAMLCVAAQAALFAIIAKVGVHNVEAAVDIVRTFLDAKAFCDAESMVAYVLDPENEGDDEMAQNAPSTETAQ